MPRRAARIADFYQSPETTTATPRIERIDTGGARRHRPPTEAVPFTVSVQQSASVAHPLQGGESEIEHHHEQGGHPEGPVAKAWR